MWVEGWVSQAQPSDKPFELLAERRDDNKWVCEVKLPLINKTVVSTSDNEALALVNTANKAAKFINEYTKNHPEFKIKNSYMGKYYEIFCNENGEVVSIGLSKVWRQRAGTKMRKRIDGSFNAIEKAIKKIETINESGNNLFIQVFDKSFFGDKSDDEIIYEVRDKLIDELHLTMTSVSSCTFANYIVVVGYGFRPIDKNLIN